ncbi:hypothetical protein IAT40_005429 [Kwoniella sp. CBS 6097]
MPVQRSRSQASNGSPRSRHLSPAPYPAARQQSPSSYCHRSATWSPGYGWSADVPAFDTDVSGSEEADDPYPSSHRSLSLSGPVSPGHPEFYYAPGEGDYTAPFTPKRLGDELGINSDANADALSNLAPTCNIQTPSDQQTFLDFGANLPQFSVTPAAGAHSLVDEAF